MTRRTLRIFGPLLAFALLSAESCDFELGGLINQPATITVTNTSTSETAVIAILADDVKSYPTLAPGQSATVKTNVGGRYEVRVVMTPENATEYRAQLTSLRRLVEKQIDGSADSTDKVKLFTDLAGIKTAIKALEAANAAGCTGTIKLGADDETQVAATVAWQTTSGAGFWDIACGST
jgi:hypothetical protein